MSPAAHAAVGAAIGGRIPHLWIAVPLALISHFFLDAIPHFELFYPLAHWLGVSHEAAFWVVAVVAGVAVGPFLLWIAWDHRVGMLFVAYCIVLTGFLIGYQTQGPLRLVGAISVTAIFAAVERSRRFLRWLACGLAATVPDILGEFAAPLDALHNWAHFRASNGLGHVFYRWFDGGPRIYVAKRFENPAFLSGYLVELAIELAIFAVALHFALRAAERIAVQEPLAAQAPDTQI